MDELTQAIQAAGNDPEELRQVALRFNLDPAFVASVAAGTSRTTMGQSFNLPLLLSSGIIPPEQLSGGFAQAEASTLREAMQDWDEAYAELVPDAPTFNRFEEAKYADNPVVADFFTAIRLGTPLSQVQSSGALKELEGSIPEAEYDQLVKDLETFDKAFTKHQQDLYEYQMSGNSPKFQAAMSALGERPTAETFDTSSARFDYAKSLGLPALALLPDPMQSPSVSAQELAEAAGGPRGAKALQSILDDINKQYDRGFYDATEDKPVAKAIRGYGAIGREPESVAPLSSIPFSARGGSGMDVYDRIANMPESQRIQGLQGAAATTGRAPQAPRGLSERDIMQLNYEVADKREKELQAGLLRLQQDLASRKPNPFQQALNQYSLFGALEANV